MRSTGISMDTSAPVVVLSPHHHGALGIFRSLGVLGVPVYAVEDGQFSPPLRSRYCCGVFRWNVRTATPRASIASLLRVSENFNTRPILIPTSNVTAALVQEAAERSEEHTSELQSQSNLVCRLLLEKKKRLRIRATTSR